MASLPEIRVEITKLEDGRYHSRSVNAADGQEIVVSNFAYDPRLLVHREELDYIEGDAGRDEGQVKPPLLADYGKRLFAWLFGDGQAIRGLVSRPEYRQGWRVTLELHPDASALWGLPWELLHDGRRAWALLQGVQLQRKPFGVASIDVPPTPRPLRILVALSSPDDQPELDTEREIAVIQNALDEAERDGLVVLDFLEEVSLDTIREALAERPVHVLHYTGHGGRDAKSGESFLALETELGTTAPATGPQLHRVLAAGKALRLVVLSGCQTAQTAHSDAFRGVATALLEDPSGLPAVVAFQASVRDDSATQFASTFYRALGRGETIEAALSAARGMLSTRRGESRADWALPALYLRAPQIRLVDPTAAKEEPVGEARRLDVGGLPLPSGFVGRKKERRELRAALRNRGVSAAYIRGLGGIGKSSLAAKLLERPGVELDDALVVRCNEVALPADIVSKVASFFQGQGAAGHAEAGAILLDSSRDMPDRVRQAASLVANQRYLLVFDNLESVMERTDGERWEVQDADLRAFFRGLFTAGWRSTCVFTGRYRWVAIEETPRSNWLDLELPGLTRWQSIMMMNKLPRLSQNSIEDKLRAYERIGGHPKTIELLDGYLADHTLAEILDDPQLMGKLTDFWEAYFLRALLERLDEAEQRALQALCVFRGAFGRAILDHVGATMSMLEHWRSLHLMQREQDAADGTARYSVHPVVREYVLVRLPEAERVRLHLQAAAHYQRPFLDMARQMWGERVEGHEHEVAVAVLQMVVSRSEPDVAEQAMAEALEWHYHLYDAGRFDEADDIAHAITTILARWGRRDQAKALLRQSVATVEGFSKMVVMGNLAVLLQAEGRLDEALATYEQVYQFFEALGAGQQMAAVLHQQAMVYRAKGDYDTAIALAERSLAIRRELVGDDEGESISLLELSILYMLKEDYEPAMARNDEALAIARRLGDDYRITTGLQVRGLILVCQGHLQDAWNCFAENLSISRRINYQAGVADTLGEMGKLLMAADQMPAAINAFNDALLIYRQVDNPGKVGLCLEMLGVVHEQQGQLEAALEKYEEALSLFRQHLPMNVGIAEAAIARVRQQMESAGSGHT